MRSVVAAAARAAQGDDMKDEEDDNQEEEGNNIEEEKVVEIKEETVKDDEVLAVEEQQEEEVTAPPTITQPEAPPPVVAAADEVDPAVPEPEFPSDVALSLPPLSEEGEGDGGVAHVAESTLADVEVDLEQEVLLPHADETQETATEAAAAATETTTETTIEKTTEKTTETTPGAAPSPSFAQRLFTIHSKLLEKAPETRGGPRRKRPSAKSFLNASPAIELQGKVILEMDDEELPSAYAFYLNDLQSETVALERQDQSDMLAVGRTNQRIRQNRADGATANGSAASSSSSRLATSTAATRKRNVDQTLKATCTLQSAMANIYRSPSSLLPSPPAKKAKKQQRASVESDTTNTAATTKKAPLHRKSESAAGRAKATEVWSGVPDEKLPGYDAWPEGWIKRLFERGSGESKGHTDRYWYSPVKQYKFRSMVEISRFFAAMEKTNHDEGEAWKIFKGRA